MANHSPEFPSVGARARFTRECEIVEVDTMLGWDPPIKVRYDDGSLDFAYEDELSPLPAAPHSGKEER